MLLNCVVLIALLLGLAGVAHSASRVHSLSKARLGPKCADKASAVIALTCWLDQNPNVAAAMYYENSSYFGTWPTWPTKIKQRLFHYFVLMVLWYGKGMPPATAPQLFPEQIPLSGPKDPTWGWGMPEDLGTKVYLAQVANCLAAELTAQFSWSIATYTPDQLSLLLDFSDWLAWVPNLATPGFYFEGVADSPANPPFTALFFKTNQLIGSDAADTVARLFQWEKQLTHYNSPLGSNWTTAEVYLYFWGPNTPPIPDAEIINGTTYTGPGDAVFGHYTAGCGGTTVFMKSVLRTVNIPVETPMVMCGHYTPKFPTAGVAMTHGDDPYSRVGWVTPYPGFPVPAPKEYLVTLSQYFHLFPPGQSGNACLASVGIQPANIGIKYGSDFLLGLYCKDLASGASLANGKVYAELQIHYPLQTLQSMGLWTTLAAKQTALDYCAKIWSGY
jgi:hypothetical protein